MQRYFPEPYRFVPPSPGTGWCRVAGYIVPTVLRRSFGIHRWEFRGLEHLRTALEGGAGVMLTPNHCRWADGLILGEMGRSLGRYCHYAISYHMFRQSRLFAWWLNKMGGFSVHREGIDRQALRASAEVVAEGRRPLVVFPEGTWYRQNDRLGPFLDGVGLIARQAARAEQRPVVIIPVAMKYWYLEDPSPAIDRWLSERERHLGWSYSPGQGLISRIERLSRAILALKEMEYLGEVRPGQIDERRMYLAEALVGEIETRVRGQATPGDLMPRIRLLRQAMVPCLITEPGRRDELERHLATLLFCEGLNSHSEAYLKENPSLERIAETAQRLEEMLEDRPERILAPLGVVVELASPLSVSKRGETGRGADTHLTKELAEQIQRMLNGLLAQGPPRSWPSPPHFQERGEVSPPPAPGTPQCATR